MRLLVAACLAAMLVPTAHAEETLTDAARKEVVWELIRLLDDLYIIHTTAELLNAELGLQLQTGAFDTTSRAEFVRQINDVLWSKAHDKHLKITDASATGADESMGAPVRIEDRAAPGGGAMPAGLRDVVPFPRAQMLDPFVGVVEVRLFAPRALAEAAAVEAMEAVSDARAILFDLRACMGGAPDMVHFITSYLYSAEPVHLLTYYHAHEEPDSAYTVDIPGRRMPDADVYILTSSFTASGGEEFAYVLKHHARATIVGETTAGAAHGGGERSLGHGFRVFMPDFRPVHPRTRADWEGSGVLPDVAVPSERALAIAHKAALETVEQAGLTKVREVALRESLARVREAIARFDEPLDLDALREYAGVYDVRTIAIDEGGLSIQRPSGPKLRLEPTDTPDAFTLRAMPNARVEFIRDGAGAVNEIRVLTPQGTWETSKRSE
jgi:hypothetical protein